MNGLPKPCYVMSEPHLSGYRVVLGYETLTEAQDAQSALSASPPAREEAPAEGAGEDLVEAGAKLLWHRFSSSAVEQWADETHKAEYRLAATDLLALRNRTSEPEAGAVRSMAFEPVEHPLYVVSEAARRQLVRAAGWIEKEAYDASGHDDPEDEGLDEAARYLRSMFDLSDEALGLVRNSMDELVPTHPAPATADKLRAVVEGFVSDLTGGHPNARKTRLVISHDALSARIEQALSALNEQPQ